MRDCHAEVFVGIHRRVVNADFVVEVGTGGATAQANVADGIAPADMLPSDDGEIGKVSVPGGDAMTVVNHDRAAITAKEIGECDVSIGRSNYGLSDAGGNIHAAMERALTIEWIDSFAERSGD
jgi:hypothetical protein